MPSINQAAGGCGCPGPPSGCALTIGGRLIGCNTFRLQSITVEAHDSTAGGTLLGTATTNSSGDYTINVTGATAGNSIVFVPAVGARFTSPNRTLTWTATGTPGATQWSCGAFTAMGPITYAAATGYHCSLDCAIPLPDTLHLTDSLYGSCVLTWTAGDWVGSLGASFGGSTNPPCLTTCAADSVTIGYIWNGGFSGGSRGVTATAGIGGDCPGHAPGPAGAIPTGGTSSSSCPFAFSFTQTTGLGDWSLARIDNLYCAGVTITIVE